MRTAETAEMLTQARCEVMKPTPGKDLRVADKRDPNLKFVVRASGLKVWFVRYVVAGPPAKQSEIRIGKFPAMTVDEARAEAVAIARKVQGGVDPVAEKRRETQEAGEAHKRQIEEEEAKRLNTFRALADLYLAASKAGHFSGRRDRTKAEGTLRKEEEILRKHVLPALGDRPLAEITRRDVIGFLERTAVKRAIETAGKRGAIVTKAEGGPGAANECLKVVRRIYAFGLDRELIAADPSIRVKPFAPKDGGRDKTATDAELRTLWTTLEAAKRDRSFKSAASKPSPAYYTAAALQVSLLTLQRRGEVAAMRKEDVSLDKSLWVIPALQKKERRKGAVPLSTKAREIIEEAMSRAGGPWVFPGEEMGEHLTPKALTRFMARLRAADAKLRADPEAWAKARRRAGLSGETAERLAAAPLVDLTPHDLRRTGRTRLTGEELQVDRDTAERLLNHSTMGGAEKAYDWNLYLGPKRAAANLWAEELMRIVGGATPQSPSNVYPLRTTANGAAA